MKLSEYINNKKEFKVGFLGGSITEGAGASKQEKRYSSLVTKALQDKYADVEFSEVNAGVGGTGSDLGIFRLEDDLLSKNPDIVFIEFAVNDDEFENTDIYIENIIRKILCYKSNIPIVMLYTAKKDMVEKNYKNGVLPNSVIKQEKVAKYYNIPSINVGKALCDEISCDVSKMTSYLPDSVHPNDIGYKLYASEILKFLEDFDFDINFNDDSVTNVIFKNPMLKSCKTVINDMWSLSNKDLYKRYPDYIYSCRPGAELNFDFEGNVIGIYLTVEMTSGILEYSIDCNKWLSIDTWDKYALEFPRAKGIILDDSLNFGNHNIKIRVSENKNEKSEGHYLRLGAFLVG